MQSQFEVAQPEICVVGAGLAGAMISTLLSKLDFKVYVFEKRPAEAKEDSEDTKNSDFGRAKSALKRSINLALSYRGQKALAEAGVLDEAMQNAIKMPCRVIHMLDGKVLKQPYGLQDDAIWSVGRQFLNKLLLDKISGNSRVEVKYGYSLISADREGNCIFAAVDGSKLEKKFTLVIGADGAYSAVRESMLRQGRISFSRQYIAHGYKELSIPAKALNTDGPSEYALENMNGLHIWPRGEFMLIALPNPDKSFTATLFAPYSGRDGFDSIDPNNAAEVAGYFQRHFPDVVPLMPNLAEDYRGNPVGSLVTVRVDPWNLGNVLLIGDAAHAVVPFYGQGMNAAFEDCFLLYNLIKAEFSREASPSLNSVDEASVGGALRHAAETFAKLRTPSANGLSELCIEHYNDMASNTASMTYLIQKRIEGILHWTFPKVFKPLYSMVAFTDTPYHEAIEISERQNRWIIFFLRTNFVLLGVGAMTFAARFWGRKATN